MIIFAKIAILLISCSPNSDSQQTVTGDDDANVADLQSQVSSQLLKKQLEKIVGEGAPKRTVTEGLGIRSFREIDATMSRVTGVASSTVRSTYIEIASLLPRRNLFDSFQAPMQVGIFHLASSYCVKLMASDKLWNAKFPDIDRYHQWGRIPLPSAERRAEIAGQMIDVFWRQGTSIHADRQQAIVEITEFVDAALSQTENPNNQPNIGDYHSLGLLSRRGVNAVATVILWTCTGILASAPMIFY